MCQKTSFHAMGMWLSRQLSLLSQRSGCLRQLMKALKAHTKALSWQLVPQSLHWLPIACGWDFPGSPQRTGYMAPRRPEVSSSARLPLKSPSLFQSVLTRVGLSLMGSIVKCVTSHQEKWRREGKKPHEETGMSTNCLESSVPIHISLFTIENCY